MWLFHKETLVGIELSDELLVYQLSKALRGVKYLITKDMMLKNEGEVASDLIDTIKKTSKKSLIWDYIDLNLYLNRLKKGSKT